MNIEEAIKDGNLLLEELKIDDTSLYTLNNELKRHTQLQAELLLLLRYAKMKLNALELQEETLVSRIIAKLCKEAEENGKPISSTAKDKLKKTDIPRFKEYRELKQELNEATEEVEYLNSLQFIMSKRAELLMAIVNLDKSRVVSEHVLNSDEGLKARVSLYEKKMKKLITNKG